MMGVAIIPCTIVTIADKDFRHYVKKIFEKVKYKIKGKKADILKKGF